MEVHVERFTPYEIVSRTAPQLDAVLCKAVLLSQTPPPDPRLSPQMEYSVWHARHQRNTVASFLWEIIAGSQYPVGILHYPTRISVEHDLVTLEGHVSAPSLFRPSVVLNGLPEDTRDRWAPQAQINFDYASQLGHIVFL